MLETQLFIILLNLAINCNLAKKVSELEIEMHYGTIPSASFPDDPRHQPEKWWQICGRISPQRDKSGG